MSSEFGHRLLEGRTVFVCSMTNLKLSIERLEQRRETVMWEDKFAVHVVSRVRIGYTGHPVAPPHLREIGCRAFACTVSLHNDLNMLRSAGPVRSGLLSFVSPDESMIMTIL